LKHLLSCFFSKKKRPINQTTVKILEELKELRDLMEKQGERTILQMKVMEVALLRINQDRYPTTVSKVRARKLENEYKGKSVELGLERKVK